MFLQNLFKTLRLKNPPKPQRCNLSLTQKLFLSSKAEPTPGDANARSQTASYLVSALGLSPESALASTRWFPAVNPKEAAKAVGALEELGFTQSQIASFVLKFPRALSPVSLKTILPKIEFLRSRGASSAEVASIVSRCPRILDRSLERHIVPTFEMISRFMESDSQAIVILMRCAGIWYFGTMSVFATNCQALAAAGVPDNVVRCMLRRQPNCLLTARGKFDSALEKVKSIGIDPLKNKFVMSLSVLINLADSTWKRKVSMFGRWGWSEEDTLRAFERYPNCMLLSEKKLGETMEFFVNEMGLEPSYFITNPILLSLSFKNRIVPRCLVVRALISKKLVQRFSPTTALMTSNTYFVEKFLSPYSAEHPSLLLLYQEKLGEVENVSR
ncbi:hypothetical protein MLD38_036209 [Melastoma candidum]|uniref:Uncharacterized protein n=1 Tax=Melastoma candidum TaxID=119954 RepID=A0ACB9LJY2_9MYRT|nr:hypothetical protein MLD38_036209 [Melastoma candidum]